MAKSPDAFRTISEVAEWLDKPAHVLRFWESKFPQVKPVKRAGGRRYYRPQDMLLLGGIRKLLHDDGMTIKGVQKLLREQGVKHVSSLSHGLDDLSPDSADAQTSLPSSATEAELAAIVDEPPEQGQVLSFQPRPDVTLSDPEANEILSHSATVMAEDEDDDTPQADTQDAPDDTVELPATAATTPPPIKDAIEPPAPDMTVTPSVAQPEPAPVSEPVAAPETETTSPAVPAQTGDLFADTMPPEAPAEPTPPAPATPDLETAASVETDSMVETTTDADDAGLSIAAPDPETDDAEIPGQPAELPSFQRAQSEDTAPDTAPDPAPEPPAAPALKPNIVAVPDTPADNEIDAAPGLLGKIMAASPRDVAGNAAQIAPLLAQYRELRARMSPSFRA